jgi:hypothetical protein
MESSFHCNLIGECMKKEMINKLNRLAYVLDPRDVYDDAIVDVDDCGRAIYSKEKVIECGIELFGSYEESLDWHDYNTFSAYLGDMTPQYISEMDEDEDF